MADWRRDRMKWKGVGMITKQEDFGEQMRGLEGVWEGGGEKGEGLLSRCRLGGSLHVTRIRCTARHEWQWWALWARDPAFSTPPNSPGQASLSLWQDEETSCQLKCDSLCLTLTLSLTHSFTLFFLLESLCWSFVYLSPFFFMPFFPLLVASASFPTLCFFLILFFLLIYLLFDMSLASHPLILSLRPFSPPVPSLLFLERQFCSGWHKNRAGGQHLPAFLDPSLISHHLSVSKALS